MKYLIYTGVLIMTVVGGFGCMKSASSTSNAGLIKLDTTGMDMLQNKWAYSFWSACPRNPLSEAPCFEYTPTDTIFYGTGHIFLNISTDNKIYRSTDGNINTAPWSYAYPEGTDTLTYQFSGDSSFVLLNASNEVLDSVKIKTLTDHLLVLHYFTPQFGNRFEIDSLTR